MFSNDEKAISRMSAGSEDSSLLNVTMSLGIWFLTFLRIIAPSSLWSSTSRRLATWEDTVYYPGISKEGSSWTKWMVDMQWAGPWCTDWDLYSTG
jgi:hypothetical protein